MKATIYNVKIEFYPISDKTSNGYVDNPKTKTYKVKASTIEIAEKRGIALAIKDGLDWYRVVSISA